MTQSTTALQDRPRVNSNVPFVARLLSTQPAHIIRDDAEALAVARRLAN